MEPAKTVQRLQIVNYCHRGCAPLKNIMRLPREEAFALARRLAAENPDTTAFYRFADFENYYPERLKTDELLHRRFLALGGRPAETHPLSFVLQGSDYLDNWFDRGIVTAFPLETIPSDFISFTCGDSQSTLRRRGDLEMLTKETLLRSIDEYPGTLEGFMEEISQRHTCIEAQVWNDACLKL